MSEIQHWKQIDFQLHTDEIRNKKHWWTNVDTEGYNWERLMKLVDTHPDELYDWNREKQRLGMNRFHCRDSAPQFAKDIHKDLVDFLIPKAPKKKPHEYKKGPPHVTNIAFVGFGQYSGSYPRHKDSMDVFLVQVINNCKITIGYDEKPTDKDEVRVMTPGDAVWIPRGTWHKLEPKVSRCTFSFGFESDPDCDPAFFV